MITLKKAYGHSYGMKRCIAKVCFGKDCPSDQRPQHAGIKVEK